MSLSKNLHEFHQIEGARENQERIYIRKYWKLWKEETYMMIHGGIGENGL